MNAEIKKKLAKNWFKILQDIICQDIEELESGKKLFISKFNFLFFPLWVCLASITINLSTYLSKIFNLRSNKICSSK